MAIYGENVKVAVTAMMQLASLGDQAVAPLSVLAEGEHLSISFLEQLFAKLKKNDLVISKRGIQGGYMLARSPMEITLFDIIQAVEKGIKITRCEKGSGGCVPGGKVCTAHKLWRQLEHVNRAILSSITLEDLILGRVNNLSQNVQIIKTSQGGES